jgi:predicted small integral membrane protein
MTTPQPLTIARATKAALLAAIALFFTLVVFNNITDFDSNYQFVRHVLMMDSTFPSNKGLWRALNAPAVHTAFYIGIITWEVLNAALSWIAAVSLFKAQHAAEPDFTRAKSIGIAALTSGMLLWFIAFITIGGEWFLMWQSKLWNGQDAAFRMFVCEGIILIVLMLPEQRDLTSPAPRD